MAVHEFNLGLCTTKYTIEIAIINDIFPLAKILWPKSVVTFIIPLVSVEFSKPLVYKS